MSSFNQLGISRSELQKLAKNTRENNIISSFNTMKKSSKYLKESEILDDGLVEEINIDEDDKWWK